jgi:hypothetical protein
MATSWTDIDAPASEQSRATPHEQWPLPLFLLAWAVLGVLVAGLWLIGAHARCASDDRISYCAEIGATTSEETP